MSLRSDLTDLSQRLAEVAARLEKRMRAEAERYSRKGETHFLARAYDSLRDLFTRDVTREDLRDLVTRDPRDTFRFFARHIDFESLRTLPWYRRLPVTAWRVFAALAFALSPARRIAFAASTLTFLWGCVLFVSGLLRQGEIVFSNFQAASVLWWWLITIGILALLLLMELRDKLGLKGDLEIAREIQFGLVPSKPFTRKNITVHYAMRPANTVGGDYYDIIELAENRLGLVVGDVAGKGMPAALMMALLQGSLRTLIAAGHRGSELVSKLNDYLYSNLPDNKLVTLFYGELDIDSGRLGYVNAGHNAPILQRAGGVERLRSTSVVLGIIPGLQVEERQASLEPGDRLLIFTDGISESFSDEDEEYGEARIEELMNKRAGLNPPDLIRCLFEDVISFCGDRRPGDDMTAMMVSNSVAHGEMKK